MPGRLVQPDPVVHARAVQQPHAPKVVDRRRAQSRSPAARASPTTGAATPAGPSEWRDMQIRLEGPAVVPLQTGFAHNWQQTTGELVSGETFYPTIEPAGPLAVQSLLSSPETGASSVRTMYYLSIVCARESIYIANPYFVPDPVAIDTLIEAKPRGVDVRIMVSGIRNDNWLARHNSVRLFGRLLAAGIEIQEFNRTMLHHKTMVVDRSWVTVGTTNFDNRSFAHNEESNVCFFDRRSPRELHAIFIDDLSGCRPGDARSVARRGAWARTQEFVAVVPAGAGVTNRVRRHQREWRPLQRSKTRL